MYQADTITLLMFLCAAVVYDLRTGKIPNRLIVGGILCALVCRIISVVWLILIGQAAGTRAVKVLAGGAVGILLPFAVLYILYFYRMIGAGDIKLLCMCGAFLGPKDAFFCIIVSFLIGGVISIILLLKRGNILSRFHYFIQYIQDTGFMRHQRSYLSGVDRDGRFCFSVPVLISVILKIGGVY